MTAQVQKELIELLKRNNRALAKDQLVDRCAKKTGESRTSILRELEALDEAGKVLIGEVRVYLPPKRQKLLRK